jgi:GAF domain-containing protein
MASTALATRLGIAPRSEEESVLRLLIELAAQFVGAEEGSLLVFDREAQELEFVMTVGSESSERTLLGQRVPVGEGVTGLAALTEEVQIGAPTYRDVKQSELRDPAGPRAVIAAPMLVADGLVGVITAVSFRPDAAFGAAEAALYGRVAATAAVVVEQRRRIDALESAAPRSAEEQRVVDAVARLAGSGDAAELGRVADLLEAIDALARGPRR